MSFRLSLVLLLSASLVFGQTKIREGSQTTGALPTAQGGVAAGGTTGQALKKNSNSDYDYSWGNVSITTGDLTADATAGFSVTGGTGAVVGAGTSLAQHVADSTHNGYLSSTDWNTFNAKSDFSGLFTDLDFTDSNLTSLETRSYNDLQDLPILNFGSHKITGGEVAWTGTGLNFIISACDYVINGVQFHSNETPVTLAASDPSQARIDVFYVDTSSLAGDITGTPAGPPIEPQVDPATQLKLTSVLIPANATEPSFTNQNIYLENTEWTMSASGGSINVASTNNPYAGTKDIEGTSVASGTFFTGVKPSGTLNPSDYTLLIFQIRSKATWANPKSISIFFMNGAVTVGSAVTLKQGAFGFDSSITSTYQQIAIPASQFNTGTSAIDRIRFAVAGGGGNIGWYIDNIVLQAGTTGTPSGGDVFSNTNVSVDGEVALFFGTDGKHIRRATGTGYATLTSGVLGSGTPAALTRTNDTNVTLTLGGTPTTALLQATSLTLGWTGTLAVGRGGTGVSSLGDITRTNDTNVTLTLGGTPTGAVITSTSFTLGWTGTLGLARGGTATDNTSVSAHNYFGNNTGSSGSAGFHQIAASEIASGAALTTSDDTNVTLTLGGTPTTALLTASSITAGWTGQLSLSRGGTGASLTDPNANRLLGWDDTDNATSFITMGTGLSYDHSTHTVSVSSTGAPSDAHYVTNQAESGLSNEVNLGALTTGYLYATVSGSVATVSSVAGTSGGVVQVDTYTTAQSATSWSKPASAVYIEIYAIGGGGSGAGGRSAATASGGGGGGGGAFAYVAGVSADFDTTLKVTVGAGGAQTSQNANGVSGNDGNPSFVTNNAASTEYLRGGGGKKGDVANNSTTGGAGGNTGANIVSTSTTGSNDYTKYGYGGRGGGIMTTSASNSFPPFHATGTGGGGGGPGDTTSQQLATGQTGGGCAAMGGGGGGGGTAFVDGTALRIGGFGGCAANNSQVGGGAGANCTGLRIRGAQGGAGGTSTVKDGGAGGAPGGGGGGGGSAATSGKGGAGGDGAVTIITHF